MWWKIPCNKIYRTSVLDDETGHFSRERWLEDKIVIRINSSMDEQWSKGLPLNPFVCMLIVSVAGTIMAWIIHCGVAQCYTNSPRHVAIAKEA